MHVSSELRGKHPSLRIIKTYDVCAESTFCQFCAQQGSLCVTQQSHPDFYFPSLVKSIRDGVLIDCMTMMKNVRLRLSVYVLCLPAGSLESQGIGQFVKVIFSPIDLNRLLFTDGPCWTSDHKGWAILLNFLPPLACCLELACPEGSLTLLLFLQLHIFSWFKLVPLCLLPSVVLILFGTF